MVKKLAIDWDESELRLVAAQCSGSNVKVTDARVIPIEGENVQDALKEALAGQGFDNAETLVAIGRGQAELRELQLPPVPDEELPDMVRFQALRSFATAGENSVVDYLVTNRSESGVEMIAAALGPQELGKLKGICEAVDLVTKRISLRPLAAAALYLLNQDRASGNDTVLIDLLADDAEIVVARGGRVIFVRTVRMPKVDSARGRALAGELRRSLVACGSSGALDRVVLWGRAEVHAQDIEMLSEASGSKVEVLDPFSLVDVDRSTKASMPEHVGRLAPLVGLLMADVAAADRLVDFLNPRQRVEKVENPYRKYIIAGVPVALCALIGFLIFRQLSALDAQIERLQNSNRNQEKEVKSATESIARTEFVDTYLDGDVNWLNEIRRLAEKAPPSDKLIVRSVSATSDQKSGGGMLTVGGAVTKPAVIDEFEESIRDEFRTVEGDGVREQRTSDKYRWNFTEGIKVSAGYVRSQRYQGIDDFAVRADAEAADAEADAEAADAADDAEADGKVSEEPETDAIDSSAKEEPSEATEEPPEQDSEEDGDVVEEGGEQSPATESTSEAEAASGDENASETEDSEKPGSTGNDPKSDAETKPESESETNSDSDIVVDVRAEVQS